MNVANLIMAHRHWNHSSGRGVPPEVWVQLPLRVKLRYVLHAACRVRRSWLAGEGAALVGRPSRCLPCTGVESGGVAVLARLDCRRYVPAGRSGGPPGLFPPYPPQCLWSQVPAVAVIGGTLACGVVLDVEQCRALGAVFGFIWFLSKLSQCEWQRCACACCWQQRTAAAAGACWHAFVQCFAPCTGHTPAMPPCRLGFAWTALAIGSLLWGAAYAVHTWPHAFMLGGEAA